MADEDQDQKTEQPTSKRLSEAREKGQVPISREVTYWTNFVGILLVVAWFGPIMMDRLISVLRQYIETPHMTGIDDHGLQTLILDMIAQSALATGLVFAIMAFTGIVGTIAQTGFFASLTLITPDFKRLAPLAGLKRIFSTNAFVELGKSFVKLVILGTMVFYTLWPLMTGIEGMSSHSLFDGMALMHREAIHLIALMLFVYGVVAVADLYYQHYQYNKNLKMTKQEVKDEHKQQEGDPMIKMRIRQLRMEKARKRMMAQVPKADVIVTNPTHYAVAMKYDSGKMSAPIVVAKGINLIAERIKEVAAEHGVPAISNPPLARALYDTVELDRPIPTQHYRAVAQIISYVYKLKKQKF